jgi:hypothetical protein
MCELLVARAAQPFALGDLWPVAARMERDGLAGYGWGAAWIDEDGALQAHHSVAAFRHDPRAERLGAVRTTAAMVHLRRPSRLSTHALPDTQPFLDPAGRFALGHNGDYRDFRAAREAYVAQGRIRGRADSEVGARWLEDHWGADSAVGDAERPGAAGLGAHLLAALHGALGGQANLGLLQPDGTAVMYAGNTENPVFAFRLGGLDVAATGLYSLDRSFFRLAAPGATDRRLVRMGRAAVLVPISPAAAGAGRL